MSFGLARSEMLKTNSYDGSGRKPRLEVESVVTAHNRS